MQFVTIAFKNHQVLVLLSEIIIVFIISCKPFFWVFNFISNFMLLATLDMFIFLAIADQFTTFGIKVVNVFIFTMIFDFKTSSYTKECSFDKSFTVFCFNFLT
jgi:hypothetical protein